MVVSLVAVVGSSLCFSGSLSQTLGENVLKTLLAALLCLLLLALVDKQRVLSWGKTLGMRRSLWKPCCLLLCVGIFLEVLSVAVSLFSVATPLDAVFSFGYLFLVIAACATTGLYEEALFRGILFDAFYAELDGVVSSRWALPCAALVSSALFGLLHVVGAGSLFLGCDVLSFLQATLKFVHATLFGFIMLAFYLTTHTVLFPALMHALYNMPFMGYEILTTTSLPTSYISGDWGDLIDLGVGVLLFIPLVVWAWRTILKEAPDYQSIFRRTENGGVFTPQK